MDDALRLILEELRQETHVPAIAGIVVSHDDVIAQAATGVRRQGSDVPVTIDDRFHVGSNTKAITATACASLVGEGLLDWQTTPSDVLPELREKILPEYAAITLEMLLSHTAGIPPYTDDEAEDFIVPDLAGVAPEQQIAFFSKWLLQNRKPINEPGAEFSYSNAGYSIAATMAEAASGKSWKTLLEETVFTPLGIDDAIIMGGWPAFQDSDQPWGHYFRDGQPVPHPPDDEYQLEPFLAPAGDVCLSLPDYGRFLQLHLKGLQGDDTLIASELIRKLHHDGLPGYGMGWGVKTLRSIEDLGVFSNHAGSAGTFIFVAAIAHSHDRAAALATNTANPDTMQGIKKIIARFA